MARPRFGGRAWGGHGTPQGRPAVRKAGYLIKQGGAHRPKSQGLLNAIHKVRPSGTAPK